MRPVRPKNDVERRLWRSFQVSGRVDLGTGDSLGMVLKEAGTDRDCQVRASLITQMLLGAASLNSGHPVQLRLSGVRIIGSIDLSGAELHHDIFLEGCLVDNVINLQGAIVKSISIARCRLPELNAVGLVSKGPISIISSRLNSIQLENAIIHGQLTLSGTTLDNPKGRTLDAAGLVIDHAMICKEGFTSYGEVMLAGARIGNQLDLDGAKLLNYEGVALQAYDITVGQSVWCVGGFASTGAVRLPAARIGSLLRITESTLTNSSTEFALHLQGLSASMIAIDATVNGTIVLQHARTGSLYLPDSPSLRAAPMMLDGLTYDALDPLLPVRQRIKWLSGDPAGFNPRPYQQLALSYRNLGRDRDARIILLAKRRAQRDAAQIAKSLPSTIRFLCNTMLRLPGLIFDALAGYGYVPLRTFFWLLVSWAAGAYFIDRDPPPFPTSNSTFNAVLYTLDLLLPTSPLGLKDRLTPQGSVLLLSIVLRIVGWVLSVSLLSTITRTMSRGDR